MTSSSLASLNVASCGYDEALQLTYVKSADIFLLAMISLPYLPINLLTVSEDSNGDSSADFIALRI